MIPCPEPGYELIKCLLVSKFQGQVCANPCPPGSYGLECKERCDCYNGALCDHVNGQCHCLPGFQGQKVIIILFITA